MVDYQYLGAGQYWDDGYIHLISLRGLDNMKWVEKLAASRNGTFKSKTHWDEPLAPEQSLRDWVHPLILKRIPDSAPPKWTIKRL